MYVSGRQEQDAGAALFVTDRVKPTLVDWVKKTGIDAGKRAGLSADMAIRMKVPERENRELRQANEILRKASAYFAQAKIDRPFRR